MLEEKTTPPKAKPKVVKKEPTFFDDYSKLLADVKRLEKSESNPFYRSKYVQLKDVLVEAKRVCLANGFIFIQSPQIENEKPVLKTVLIHGSGKELESTLPLVVKDDNDPQKFGSAITYMRRYALMTILGIEEADDDGNKGSGVSLIAGQGTTIPPSRQPAQTAPTGRDLGVCKDCGAPNALSKNTGQPYCSGKCWLNPQSAPAQAPATKIITKGGGEIPFTTPPPTNEY